MDPMKVPELLAYIAGHVGNPVDLSRFTLADQFTHSVVNPYLYRRIDIPFDFVHSLALSFKNHPDLAAECRHLSFCEAKLSKDREVLSEDRERDEMQCLENDLVAIFNALAQHGNLQILQWKIYRWYRGNRVVFSADVWTAISNAAVHLRELDFCIQVGESETWVSDKFLSLQHAA
jgi:hypothetical protein